MRPLLTLVLCLVLAACSTANPNYDPPDIHVTVDPGTRELTPDAGRPDAPGPDATDPPDATVPPPDTLPDGPAPPDATPPDAPAPPDLPPDDTQPDTGPGPDSDGGVADMTPADASGDIPPDLDTPPECTVTAACSDPGLPANPAPLTVVPAINVNAGQGGSMQDLTLDLQAIEIEASGPLTWSGTALGRLTLDSVLSTCGTFQMRLRIDLEAPLHNTTDQNGGGRWEVPGIYNGPYYQTNTCDNPPFEVVSYTRNAGTFELYGRGTVAGSTVKMHLTFARAP